MDTFVLLSSFGMRSKFSNSVRVAVATIPGTEIKFSQGREENWNVRTRLDCSMADINQEHVHSWLRRSNHILSRSDELHDRIIQLSTSPPISRLIPLLIPIKQLGDLVGHRTHATPPPVPIVDELDEGVNVCSTSPTAGDNRICDKRNWFFALFH
jgi:hypothetical protein